jgi:hypothetical protein
MELDEQEELCYMIKLFINELPTINKENVWKST